MWELSTTINGRGFHIDRAFAEAARQIAQAAAPEIDAELAEPHRRHRHRHQPDRTAASLAAASRAACCRNSTGRRSSGSSSTSSRPRCGVCWSFGSAVPKRRSKKINALLSRAGDDDRIRGAFRYHGAATGRWSGEGFQPQNLKRPTVEISMPPSLRLRPATIKHVKKLISQAARGCWRLQPRDDLCCSRAHADRRRLQLD